MLVTAASLIVSWPDVAMLIVLVFAIFMLFYYINLGRNER